MLFMQDDGLVKMKHVSISAKVSVIVPTYNGSEFIEETINSVIEQDYCNVELIVIDDCSTDNTVKVVSKLESKFNFKFLSNETNQGLMKTNNIAVKESSGEYLLILGHDDLLASNHIAQLLNDFKPNDVMLWCNSDVIDANGKIVEESLKNYVQLIKNKFTRPLLMVANYISSTGAIIRRSTFDQVGGFSEQYRHFGEWTLWIKLAAKGQIKFSTQTKSYYRRHDENMTSESNIKKSRTVLDNFYISAKELAELSFKLNLIESVFSYIYTNFHAIKKSL